MEEIMEQDKELSENISIGKTVTTFTHNITSLSNTLPLTMRAVISEFEAILERQQEFEKDNIEHEINGQQGFFIKTDAFSEYLEINKQIRNYGLAVKNVPNSLLVSLVSQYDAFLGKLLKIILLTKPELLNSSEKAFTLAQLVEFGSVSDARNYILEKEVEGVIRKSHAEHFQWMENKFNMQLRKDLDVWQKFIELTERRNLFVHTGGVVSNQYLKACQEHGVVWNKKPNLDDILEVTPEYFQNAVNIIFEVGVKLAHVLWRKFKPTDLENADKNLLDIAYEPLHDGNYELSKTLFNFATITLKKHSNESRRKIFVVNRALSYKWSGDEKKACEIIDAEDWSDTRDKFRLAEAVIKEKYVEAIQIMHEIGINEDEVGKHGYRSWSLFKEFRKKPEFLKAYEDIFSEPLNKLPSQNALLEIEEEIKSSEDTLYTDEVADK